MSRPGEHLDWTRETFGFADDVKEWDEKEIPEQLAELNNQMLQQGFSISRMLPHYIPEGYEPVFAKADDREDVTVFFCQLQRDDDTIVLQYRFWKGSESLAETQKDANAPESYKNQNGQLFYIAQNEELFNAKWSKGAIECSIFNVSSREELVKILDSIQGD